MKYTIKFSCFEEHEQQGIKNLCQLVNLEWLDLQREGGIHMPADLTVEGHRDDITEFELKCALLISTVSEVVPEHAFDLPMTDMDFKVEFRVQAKFADRAIEFLANLADHTNRRVVLVAGAVGRIEPDDVGTGANQLGDGRRRIRGRPQRGDYLGAGTPERRR